jgi:predicted small secreted protein
MMSRALVLLLIASWSILASGCNTIRGIGRDIDSIGEAIQRSAR